MITNNTAMSICVASLCEYMLPLLGINIWEQTGWVVHSLYWTFWRPARLLIQSGYAIFQSHQQGMRVPVAPHSHQHLVLVSLFNFNSSNGHVTYPVVVLICLFPIINDTKPLSMWLLEVQTFTFNTTVSQTNTIWVILNEKIQSYQSPNFT